MAALVAAIGMNGLFLGVLKYSEHAKNREFAKGILSILPFLYIISLFAFVFYLYVLFFAK